MKRLLVTGVVSFGMFCSANAVDFEISPVIGKFQQDVDSSPTLKEFKWKGTYYGVKAGLGQSIGSLRVEGDLGAYWLGSGDASLRVEDSAKNYNFYYTSGDYKHAEIQAEGRVGYTYGNFDGNLKRLTLTGYIPLGYSYRKMDVEYTGIENGQPIDGSYSDNYKYLYTGLGVKGEYSIFYLDTRLIYPLKNKTELDKTYLGLGMIEKDLGHKLGYKVEAGVKWKIVKAGVFYEQRNHKGFYDETNDATNPSFKEKRLGLSVGLVF